MQHTLTGLALVLIMAIVAAIFGPLAVDWSRHKEWISAQLAQQSGLRVALDGVVEVTLLPVPSLRAGKVKLSDPRSSVQIAARDFAANLSLSALLRGQIMFEDMRLDRAEVRIDADGIEALPYAALPAGIQHLRLSNSDVILTRGSRPVFAVNDLTVQGSATASLVKLDGSWQRDGQWERGGFVISPAPEATALKLRIGDEAGRHQWELAGAFDKDMRFEGQMKADWAAELPVAVSGPVTMSRQGFFAPRLEGRLGKDSGGVSLVAALRGEWQGSVPTELLVTVPYFDIDAVTGEAPASIPTRLKRLKAMLPALAGGSRAMRGGFDFTGLRLNDQTLNDVRSDFALADKKLALPRLTLKAPFGATVAVSDAAIAMDGTGALQADVDAPDLAQLMAWFEGRPATETQALTNQATLDGRLAWTPDSFRIDALRYHSLAGDAAGMLALTWRQGENPKAMLDVAGDNFDLESLRPLAGSFLSADADLKLSLKQAALMGQTARNVIVDLTQKDRVLTLRRLAAAGFAGADFDVKGHFGLDGLGKGQGISGHVVLRELEPLRALLQPGTGWQPVLPVLAAALPFDGTVTLSHANGMALKASGVTAIGDISADMAAISRAGFSDIALQFTHDRPDVMLSPWRALIGTALSPMQMRSQLSLRYAPQAAGLQQTIRLALGDQVTATAQLAPTGGPVSIEGRDIGRLAQLIGLPATELPPGLALGGMMLRDAKGWTLELAATPEPSVGRITLREENGKRRASLMLAEIDAEWLGALLLGEGILAQDAQGNLSALPLIWPSLAGLEMLSLSAPRLVTPYGAFEAAQVTLRTQDDARIIALKAKDLAFDGRLTQGAGTISIDGQITRSGENTPWALKGGGRGASFKSLVDSLAGEGELTLNRLVVRGLHPDGVRLATQMAEERLDAHKAMSEAEVSAALTAQLAPPFSWGKAVLPLRLTGTEVTALPVVLAPEAGKLAIGGRFSAVTGEAELAGTLTARPMAGSETLPQLAFAARRAGAEMAATPELDDALQWMALRLVEREIARINAQEKERAEREKAERERLEREKAERERQRAAEKNSRPATESSAPISVPSAAAPAPPAPRFEDVMRRAIERQPVPQRRAEPPVGVPMNLLPVP